MNRLLFVTVFSIIFLLIDYYAFQAIRILIANSSVSFQRIIKIVYFAFTFLVIAAIVIKMCMQTSPSISQKAAKPPGRAMAASV